MNNHTKATKNPDTNEYDKFTSVGSYPLFYVTTKDVCVCADCANQSDDWNDIDIHIRGSLYLMDINYENPDLYCDICEERIESAYDEGEANENNVELKINDLDELFEMMKINDQRLPSWDKLPVFGDIDHPGIPAIRYEIWSWDDTRAIVGRRPDDIEIVNIGKFLISQLESNKE